MLFVGGVFCLVFASWGVVEKGRALWIAPVKKVDAEIEFAVPRLNLKPTENKDSRILSPKKGAKVNTAFVPSYMRSTSASLKKGKNV